MKPQLSGDQDLNLKKGLASIGAVMTYTIVFAIIGKIFIGMSLKKFWPLFLNLQLHMFIILDQTQAEQPGIIYDFGQTIQSLVLLKFIPFDLVLKEFITMDEETKQIAAFIVLPILAILMLGVVLVAIKVLSNKWSRT